MRLLFLLVVLANIALFAVGQGFFGTPPYKQGQQARQPSQINPQALKLGPPSPSAE